jgi:PKD repeat protein
MVNVGENVVVVIDSLGNYLVVGMSGGMPPSPLIPEPDFSADYTTRAICNPNVTFTDLSTNAPTSWEWTFGDGGTSTVKNPVHSYTSAGSFDVALTATNAYGFKKITKYGYILVNPQSFPQFFLPPSPFYCGGNNRTQHPYITSSFTEEGTTGVTITTSSTQYPNTESVLWHSANWWFDTAKCARYLDFDYSVDGTQSNSWGETSNSIWYFGYNVITGVGTSVRLNYITEGHHHLDLGARCNRMFIVLNGEYLYDGSTPVSTSFTNLVFS